MSNMKPEEICDVQMLYDGEASPPQSLQMRNIFISVINLEDGVFSSLSHACHTSLSSTRALFSCHTLGTG